MDVRFGRIYDCGQCYNKNAFDIYTTSNISVFTIGKGIIEDKIKRGRY